MTQNFGQLPISVLLRELARLGGAYKFSSNGHGVVVERDEHATLSAPVSVTL